MPHSYNGYYICLPCRRCRFDSGMWLHETVQRTNRSAFLIFPIDISFDKAFKIIWRNGKTRLPDINLVIDQLINHRHINITVFIDANDCIFFYLLFEKLKAFLGNNHVLFSKIQNHPGFTMVNPYELLKRKIMHHSLLIRE